MGLRRVCSQGLEDWAAQCRWTWHTFHRRASICGITHLRDSLTPRRRKRRVGDVEVKPRPMHRVDERIAVSTALGLRSLADVLSGGDFVCISLGHQEPTVAILVCGLESRSGIPSQSQIGIRGQCASERILPLPESFLFEQSVCHRSVPPCAPDVSDSVSWSCPVSDKSLSVGDHGSLL